MKLLIIINDAPYQTEKVYNALRIAMAMQKEFPDTADIQVFLMADAVTSALKNQKSPQGNFYIERMLNSVISNNGQVLACGSACETRGLTGLALLDGVKTGTMNELAKWICEADKMMVF